MSTTTLSGRIEGSLVGLAAGDALGTTLEFMKGGFTPMTDIVGGGKFNLLPGQWTDDTSMALCLCQSLISNKGNFDPCDQLETYLKWYREGHLGSNGQCFDIGIATRTAVLEFEKSKEPYPASTSDQARAGNGSLMRLAPVPLLYHKHPELALKLSADSSRTTHGSPLAIDACRYFAGLLIGALNGVSKEELLSEKRYSPIPGYWEAQPLAQEIDDIVKGSYKTKNPPELVSSGYVVHTLESVLWAFYHTDNFSDGALKVVNLGGDSDTAGAIYGQIAGAFYGIESIPDSWKNKVFFRELIKGMANEIFTLSAYVTSDQGVVGENFPSKEYNDLWKSFISMEDIHAKVVKKVLPGPHAYKSVQEFEDDLAKLKEEYFGNNDEDTWRKYFWAELCRIVAQEKEQVQQRTSRKPMLGFPFKKKQEDE